jgi:hypothetical protein
MRKINLDNHRHSKFVEIYKEWCKTHSNVTNNFIHYLDTHYRPLRITELSDEEIRYLSTTDNETDRDG